MQARNRIGFMQGRLCDRVDGRIQAFPWDDWRGEFRAAHELGITLMEWTLDHDRMDENPLMTPEGRAEIRALSRRYGIEVRSLTGDNFMQAPFWKAASEERRQLIEQFKDLIAACGDLGVRFIVVPFVDGGQISDRHEEDIVVEVLKDLSDHLDACDVSIAFETDYAPAEVARFLGRLPARRVGVNYDIGNSAALGFDPGEELRFYGDRVLNVHIKDRPLGGTTVPLGQGDANFDTVFFGLASASYRGAYILQTARADDNRHAEHLGRYRDMAVAWIEDKGA